MGFCLSDDTTVRPLGLPGGKSIEGLPGNKTALDFREEASLTANVDRSRICPKCKREGRTVSNYLGVNVHCGPCKTHWPVTNSPLRPESPSVLQRGISKQTAVEPDWNVATNGDT